VPSCENPFSHAKAQSRQVWIIIKIWYVLSNFHITQKAARQYFNKSFSLHLPELYNFTRHKTIIANELTICHPYFAASPQNGEG